MDFSVGEKLLDRYLLLRQVGRGGMGVTYLADDQALGKQVAIKVQIQSFSSTDQNFRVRQRIEAKNIASLDHPNVVKMVDFFEIQGNGFLVTDYIDGITLDKIIRKQKISANRPENHRLLLDYLRQIISGLEAIHDVGIVHRDMKPSNILVNREGTVKITDFGISKSSTADDLTTAGIVVGTALYISPEQARGREATALSDLYSFGVIAFELTQGFRPFAGASAVDVASKHIFEPVPKMISPINDEFEWMIQSLMAKNPVDRPQSALQVRKIIEHIARSITSAQSTKQEPIRVSSVSEIKVQRTESGKIRSKATVNQPSVFPPGAVTPVQSFPPQGKSLNSGVNSDGMQRKLDGNGEVLLPDSSFHPGSTQRKPDSNGKVSLPDSSSNLRPAEQKPDLNVKGGLPNSGSNSEMMRPKFDPNVKVAPLNSSSDPGSTQRKPNVNVKGGLPGRTDTGVKTSPSAPYNTSVPRQSSREFSTKEPFSAKPQSAQSTPTNARPAGKTPTESSVKRPASTNTRTSSSSPVKFVDHQFRIIMGGLLIIMALALSAIIYMTALIIGGSAGI